VLSGYRFGEIRVDGVLFTGDLMLTPDGPRPWEGRQGHTVRPADLEPLLAADPTLLVIGTGHDGLLTLSPEAEEAIAAHGVAHVMALTEEAVELWNKRAPNERACALLHLTC